MKTQDNYYHRKCYKTRIKSPIPFLTRIVRQPKSDQRIPRRQDREPTETFSNSDLRNSDCSSSDFEIRFVLDIEFRIDFDTDFCFEKIGQLGFASSKRNLNSSLFRNDLNQQTLIYSITLNCQINFC